MSHLLAIAVGPVQEFIAAARRTRDLWFGSYLLSEISKAVAKAVETDGGKLVFPASSDAENVANVILAELPSGEPRKVVDTAKYAGEQRWLEFAGEALREASSEIRQDIWDDQLKDVIEFYAAWVPHLDPANYSGDRAKVMRLLAGRKSCRDFLPAKGRAGVPKSSLDGHRESVLVKREKYPTRFRIRKGEQLDVVGLVKRVTEGNRPYPSVSRIAADPWVRGNKDKPEFEELKKTCEEPPKKVLHRLDSDVFSQFKDFPYEGTAVYRSRHHEWEEEIDDADRISLSDLQDSLGKLPEPSPYLAVLVADGDKMGATIAALSSAEAHREFSKALAGCADEARMIVNDHSGVLVYAGGDDVLAFLPVDKCLGCARALRNKFIECLRPQVPEKTPTLSVGIAIGHFMENLEDLLDYGRAAEKAAKKVEGKDALAVHLHKRGGSPIKIRGRWCDENPLDVKLPQFAKWMIDGEVPTKLPYELRAMATLYESWKENADAAIQQDLLRVIAKKTSKGVVTVKAAMEKFTKDMDSKKLLVLAEEMLVARQIAVALKQAGGESWE